jgi:ADP-heptose:LPS heptosyltransferase
MSLNVDTMRTIDHRVGVPLCALVTPFVMLFDWLNALLGKPVGKPRRLLFVELSEMGSAILVDPAMREAKARGAEIYFLIFKSNKASLTLLNTVPAANIFTIDASSLVSLVTDTIKFLFQARVKKIDTVIDLELFSRFTALLTGLCGARRRVGYHIFHGEGLWRGNMLTHKVHYNPHIHIAKNFMALIHAAFSTKAEQPFSKVHITDASIQIAQAVIKPSDKQAVLERIERSAREAQRSFTLGQQPLLLVNPNASELLVQRRWAPESFSALIVALQQKWPDCLILITGSPAEQAYVENVRRGANVPNALNFAGQVSFAELPALYTLADKRPPVSGVTGWTVTSPGTTKRDFSVVWASDPDSRSTCSPSCSKGSSIKVTYDGPSCLRDSPSASIAACISPTRYFTQAVVSRLSTKVSDSRRSPLVGDETWAM